MNRTLSFLLSLFGVVGLLAGGMSYVVFREINLWVGTFLLVGLGLLLAGIILNYQEVSRVARGRSAAKAFNALIETVVVLAIVGFLYAIVARYPQAKVDLTANQRLSLAPQTINILKSLDQLDTTVTVTACITADSGFILPVETLLRKYRDQSPRFEYEIVDFVKNPTVRQRFGERGERIELGTTFVQSGVKLERLAWPLSEEKLTNAVLKVIREQTTTIYFTEGHGEPPLEPADPQSGFSFKSLKSELEDQTYIVKSLNIAAQEGDPIPPDCDILVVGGPTGDFYPAEVDAIRAYLRRGGMAMFLLDPPIGTHKPGAVSLWPLLLEYGVSLERAVVVENNQFARLMGIGPIQPICQVASDHPVVRGLERASIVLHEAVPMSTVNLANYKVTTTPLLQTGERSWAETDFDALEGRGSGTVARDPDTERAGPLTTAMAVEAEILDGTGRRPGDMTRLIVVGDSDFLISGNMRRENSFFARNAITWLSQYDEQIGIPPRDQEDTSLILDPGQKAMVLWIPTTALPGVVLIAALIVLFLRRRYA